MTQLYLQTIFYALFRWLHIAAVVVAIGGTFALRYVMLPTINEEEEGRRPMMHQRMRKRLFVLVPIAIGCIIVSGMVNLIRALTVPPAPQPIYHMLFGIKMILAFSLFTFATLLVLPTTPPNRFQRNRKFWLTMNTHLGFLIIAVSVALRFLSGK